MYCLIKKEFNLTFWVLQSALTHQKNHIKRLDLTGLTLVITQTNTFSHQSPKLTHTFSRVKNCCTRKRGDAKHCMHTMKNPCLMAYIKIHQVQQKKKKKKEKSLQSWFVAQTKLPFPAEKFSCNFDLEAALTTLP